MKILLASLIFAICLPGSHKSSLRNKNMRQLTTTQGFAVVELFTSEGCSSCPPADNAVEALLKEYPENVYLLAFHVDYWNNLGWKDEFSEAGYSQRQQQYGSSFHLNSIYTPQVVVNGKKEFVGSDKNLLEKTTQAEISNGTNIAINIEASTIDDKIVAVQYPAREKSSGQILNIALVQLNAATDVKRGENKGLKLKHVNVVRDFKVISMSDGKPGEIKLDIPAGLTKKDCLVIAYLQDKNNRQIVGATSSKIR